MCCSIWACKVRCSNYHIWQRHEVTLPCLVMGMAPVVFVSISVLQRHELLDGTSVMALYGAQFKHGRSGAQTAIFGKIWGRNCHAWGMGGDLVCSM